MHHTYGSRAEVKDLLTISEANDYKIIIEIKLGTDLSSCSLVTIQGATLLYVSRWQLR